MQQRFCAVLVGLLLLCGSAVPGVAMMPGGGGGFHGGFQGGMPGGFHGGMPGGFQGGFRGGVPGGFHSGVPGGFHGGVPPNGFHGGFHDGHFPHNGHAVHTRVFIGGSFFFGGPFWWGPGPYYAGYAGSPVVVESAPPTYIQQAPASAYWYYCPSSQSYYPYVTACPDGWLTVVPPAQ
jgi:hypothetical protein